MTKNKLPPIIILLVMVFMVVLFVNKKSAPQTKINTGIKSDSLTPSPTSQPFARLKQSIFIPYWALEQDNKENNYSEYYYFGVTPTREGELGQEQGKKNVELLDNTLRENSVLVVRMMDKEVSEQLMSDNDTTKRFKKELINFIDENKFKGVAFDIEIPFSLNTDKTTQITKFVQQMCSSIKSDYKTCDLVVYGDTFYRKRPFDMKSLGAAADKIMVMAYDFHKAGGEPGPNFPLSRKGRYEEKDVDYGYDFKDMVNDFMSMVPKEKLVIIYGMYGYDWTLNAQGMPLKSASAISVNNVRIKIKNQQLKMRENEAKEKNIEYVDEEGSKHVVWYEDEESAAVKTKYLQDRGVSQISFWANGYF